MNIKLSTAQAWKKAAAPQSEADQAAVEMVTDNIIARLKAGKDVNFLHEIGKIIQDTDGDQATRDMLLHQIMGIAEQQGEEAYTEIENQIYNLTSMNNMRNHDVMKNHDATALGLELIQRQRRNEIADAHLRLVAETNRKIWDLK